MNDGERCARCGHVGEDRRTLIVACFYALNELPIPFGEIAIEGIWKMKVGEEESKHPLVFMANRPPLMVPVFEAAEDAKPRAHHFFTLRICKDCRGEWMAAMDEWFRTLKCPDRSSGSGIFVREHGRNVEISREEWNRRNPGREPVVFKSSQDTTERKEEKP